MTFFGNLIFFPAVPAKSLSPPKFFPSYKKFFALKKGVKLENSKKGRMRPEGRVLDTPTLTRPSHCRYRPLFHWPRYLLHIHSLTHSYTLKHTHSLVHSYTYKHALLISQIISRGSLVRHPCSKHIVITNIFKNVSAVPELGSVR